MAPAHWAGGVNKNIHVHLAISNESGICKLKCSGRPFAALDLVVNNNIYVHSAISNHVGFWELKRSGRPPALTSIWRQMDASEKQSFSAYLALPIPK